MSIKLIDVEEINTSFEEIIQLKQENICSSCKQNLTPVPDKQHLLKCNNCSKYSLMKNNDFDINVIIHMCKFICIR
jgi:DNA-directed RNA polymerase subunit RPC12/RpoP